MTKQMDIMEISPTGQWTIKVDSLQDELYTGVYGDALVTWNPSDHDLNKIVMTPVEIME